MGPTQSQQMQKASGARRITLCSDPDAGTWFPIVGSNVAGLFELWSTLRLFQADNPDLTRPTIIEQVRLGLARRPGVGETEIPTTTLRAVPGIESRIDEIDMPLLEISSTDLRERVRDGRPTDFLVTPAVRAVIDELGLYVDS